MRKILSAVTLFALALTSTNASASDLRLFHVVKNGDSLSAIALAYKTSVKTLQELNNKRGEKIVIGSRIQVPWPDTELAAAQDLRTTVHEVLPGDGLGTIALRYNSDAHCIRLLNALPDDRIKIGQKLRIPTTGPDYIRTDVAYTITGGDTLGKDCANARIDDACREASKSKNELAPAQDWPNHSSGALGGKKNSLPRSNPSL